MSFSVQPETIIATAAALPSPALGPGQLREGAIVFSVDGTPAAFWVNGDGITIPRTLVPFGGGSAIVPGPVNIFANFTTGLDTNPGTNALPVKTLFQAFTLSALQRSQTSNTITLQATSGPWIEPLDEVLSVPEPMPGAPPLRFAGQAIDSGSGTLTATGGTTGSLVPPVFGTITGVFPAGAFNKLYGIWLPGSANAGTRFPIISNSAGTITVDHAFTFTPLAGDQFTVASNPVIQVTGSLTFVGGPLLRDTLQFSLPAAFAVLHGGIVLSDYLPYVQDNAVSYVSLAGQNGSAIQTANLLVSGRSEWAIPAKQPPCGCVYDGSGSLTPMTLGITSLEAGLTNVNLDTIFLTLDGSRRGGKALFLSQVHQFRNGGITLQGACNINLSGGIYTGLINIGGGIGPGCIAARKGGVIDAALCNISASGVAGIPIFSLDQSRGNIAAISGANPAASLILSALSGSTCEVNTITATNLGGTTLAQIGGNAATSSIAGAPTALNDLAVPATSQLCYVNSQT